LDTHGCPIAAGDRHDLPGLIDKRVPADVAPKFLSSCDWSLVVGNALLGGGGGDPRSGAVGGAQRSGSPSQAMLIKDQAGYLIKVDGNKNDVPADAHCMSPPDILKYSISKKRPMTAMMRNQKTFVIQ
jgi:hypothetical protein